MSNIEQFNFINPHGLRRRLTNEFEMLKKKDISLKHMI